MRMLRRSLLAMQGYERLNYVQNPDNAFFLFDYNLTEKNKFVFDGCIDEVSPNNVFAGTDNFYLGNGNYSNNLFACYGTSLSINAYDLFIRHTFEIGKNTGLKIDGKIINKTGTANSFVSKRKLSILGNLLISGKILPFKGKMWTFSLYEDDKLIMHLIPVKRKKDMLVGAYDLLNNKFYTSYTDAKFVGGVNETRELFAPFFKERRVA